MPKDSHMRRVSCKRGDVKNGTVTMRRPIDPSNHVNRVTR